MVLDPRPDLREHYLQDHLPSGLRKAVDDLERRLRKMAERRSKPRRSPAKALRAFFDTDASLPVVMGVGLILLTAGIAMPMDRAMHRTIAERRIALADECARRNQQAKILNKLADRRNFYIALVDCPRIR